MSRGINEKEFQDFFNFMLSYCDHVTETCLISLKWINYSPKKVPKKIKNICHIVHEKKSNFKRFTHVKNELLWNLTQKDIAILVEGNSKVYTIL